MAGIIICFFKTSFILLVVPLCLVAASALVDMAFVYGDLPERTMHYLSTQHVDRLSAPSDAVRITVATDLNVLLNAAALGSILVPPSRPSTPTCGTSRRG
jgi:hypothetical protein